MVFTTVTEDKLAGRYEGLVRIERKDLVDVLFAENRGEMGMRMGGMDDRKKVGCEKT